jgi:hypothetical protein
MSWENRATDGSVTYPWGRDVVGRLFYTADGWMAGFLAKPQRVPFGTGDILGGKVEEVVEAAHGWISYCGRYDYSPGVVTHHVEMSFFPNWVGGDQKRYVQLDGETLTLNTDPILLEGENRFARLIWKRLR